MNKKDWLKNKICHLLESIIESLRVGSNHDFLSDHDFFPFSNHDFLSNPASKIVIRKKIVIGQKIVIGLKLETRIKHY